MEFTPPTHGKSIAEQVWDRMDALIDQIKDTSATDVFDPLIESKAKANELASVLVLMCRPYYPTAKDVLREANKRWKIRQGEADFEPTPGYRYNPPPAGTKYKTEQPKVAAKVAPKTAGPTPKQRGDICQAYNLGLSVAEIAKVYSLSEAMVKAVIGEAGL